NSQRRRVWARVIGICRGNCRPAPQHRSSFRPQLESLEARVVLDDNALGPNGIYASDLHKLGLTGSGVSIGQVEADRPAVPGIDADANPVIKPTQTFVKATLPAKISNDGIEEHPQIVAGIMIAKEPMPNTNKRGVAHDAKLYASAAAGAPWPSYDQRFGMAITDRRADSVKFSQGPIQLEQRRLEPSAASGVNDRGRGGTARAVVPNPGTRGSASPHA